ncbi:MAG: hypothetical protein AB4063_13740 [Crocosphaera sp.]
MIPQAKPEITAINNSNKRIPPGRKEKKPKPLRKYKPKKSIREIKKVVLNVLITSRHKKLDYL